MLMIVYYYLAMSVVTATAFFLDKRFAEYDMRRIPEKWLHSLELLGGWVGALAASELFRHKRQKQSYMIVLYIISAIHVSLWLIYFLVF